MDLVYGLSTFLDFITPHYAKSRWLLNQYYNSMSSISSKIISLIMVSTKRQFIQIFNNINYNKGASLKNITINHHKKKKKVIYYSSSDAVLLAGAQLCHFLMIGTVDFYCTNVYACKDGFWGRALSLLILLMNCIDFCFK